MNELQELDLSTFESETINTTEEEFPTATTTEYNHLEVTTISPESTKLQTQTPNYKDHVEQEDPDSEPVAPTYSSPEGQPEDPEKTATENPTHQTLTQKQIIPEPIIPSPDSDPVQHRYTNLDSVQPESPHSPPQYPQVVVIDEDEDLNVDGKSLGHLILLWKPVKSSTSSNLVELLNGVVLHGSIFLSLYSIWLQLGHVYTQQAQLLCFC